MADTDIAVKQVVVGPIQTNCYIVYKKGASSCVVIDPGYDGERIAGFIKEQGMSLDAVLLTHGHFDHFEGVPALTAELPAKVYILDLEQDLIRDPKKNGSAGLMRREKAIEVENVCHDGEVLKLAGIEFKVIHTPGHTAGGCCYYIEEKGLLFAGDTIFMESIGRTDLPTGDMSEILRSIREKILTLPDYVKILPGHGPVTDVAYASAYNPYA